MSDTQPQRQIQAPAELVERVATAIMRDATGWLPSDDPKHPFYSWMRTNSVGFARVAFAEIEAAGYVVVPREPTERMMQGGYDQTAHQQSMNDVDRWMLANIWTGMIDAFLAQGVAR